MKPRLLIDISQFAGHPLPTGIQRTLLFMTRFWPEEQIDADFGFLSNGSSKYAILALEAFRESLEWTFNTRAQEVGLAPGSHPEPIFERLSGQTNDFLYPDKIPQQYDGYLLPEHTFNDQILETVETCLEQMSGRCFAIAYDALPQTHPQYFWGPHQGGTDRYFLVIARFKNLAFISQRSRLIFEERVIRKPVVNPLVIPLGADAFGQEANPAPGTVNFLVVGTVEPRKLHRVILAAFDRLWESGRDYRLVFLGPPGWMQQEVMKQIYRRARENGNFRWVDKAADVDVFDAIRSATGLIFISQLEGYGLPPLEALALGCPVIVSEGLPSLEGLPARGQIRLKSVTEDVVAAAVDRMAEPAVNKAMREEIRELRLPTWVGAVRALAEWIKDTINSDQENRSGMAGKEPEASVLEL